MKNYSNIPPITVSNSTKEDLENLGFKRILIVHNGLNVEPVDRIPEKAEKPTVIFVGRMKKAKKPQDVIEAFKMVKKEIKKCRTLDGWRWISQKEVRIEDKGCKILWVC